MTKPLTRKQELRFASLAGGAPAACNDKEHVAWFVASRGSGHQPQFEKRGVARDEQAAADAVGLPRRVAVAAREIGRAHV